MTRAVWVIGSGLLGGAIRRTVIGRSDWKLVELPSLPWADPGSLASVTLQNFDALRQGHSEWSIVWAAGVASMSSSAEAIERELDQFRVVMNTLERAILASETRGSLFFASSVGAVYAGSAAPPFTEETTIEPTSPYGSLKAAMEEVVRAFAAASSTPTLIGRITNLYGPGQSVEKLQGLITHLILARYGGRPTSIFVPLDTVRDYLYVDDCAHLVLDALLRLEAESAATVPVVTKILGSGEAVSISTLLGHLRFITKVSPAVALGIHESSSYQAPDLRVRSVVWPELDRRSRMPLAAGFHATMLDVLRLLQR